MKACKRCSSLFEPRRGGAPQVFCSKFCNKKFYNDKLNPLKPRITARRRGDAARAIEFTDEQKQIIYGTIFGDGSLIKIPSGKCKLSMTHSVAQKDYLQWKRDQLAFAFHKETPILCSKGDSRFYVIASVCHPFFEGIYSTIYNRGRKHLPPAVIDHLTPLMLAVWYQDDGTFCKNERARQAMLCTDAFPVTETEYARHILRSKYNLNVSMLKMPATGYMRGRDVVYHRLVILRSSIADFFDIVRPHIHPCMAYKIV